MTVFYKEPNGALRFVRGNNHPAALRRRMFSNRSTKFQNWQIRNKYGANFKRWFTWNRLQRTRQVPWATVNQAYNMYHNMYADLQRKREDYIAARRDDLTDTFRRYKRRTGPR